MKHGVRQLRIVGGSHRGRPVHFPDLPGLRPTPDRVRETLFNWLAPHIAGMRVLDLFAGSGALGLEALSRGAASATLVELDRGAVAQLGRTVSEFALQAARIERADALEFLHREAGPWDLIFVDPPFSSGLAAPALRVVGELGRLAPDGFCYVEGPREAALPALPAGWTVHRSGAAGEVGYHLLHDARSDLSGDV